MRRKLQFVALVGSVTSALAAGWATAAPAGAATPPVVSHEQLNFILTGIPVCGFTVDSLIQGTHTDQMFTDASGDMRFQDETHVISTLTNEANGNEVHVEGTGVDRQPFPVANPDGTFTFTDTLAGSPIRIYTSRSDVLVKDVGFLSIVDTVDAQGNVINEQVIVHGVHEVSGPDDPAFCEAIASALGG